MKTFKELLQEICTDASDIGCDGLHTVNSELINEAKEALN